jgi:hypothetical protein
MLVIHQTLTLITLMKFTTLMALPKLNEKMIQEIIDDILSIKNTGHLSKEKEYLMPELTDDINL